MVWNQFGSDGEGTSAWAVFSRSISWAVIPASIVGNVRSWVWMAELFSEEWSLVKRSSSFIVCIWAVPFTLGIAAASLVPEASTSAHKSVVLA